MVSRSDPLVHQPFGRNQQEQVIDSEVALPLGALRAKPGLQEQAECRQQAFGAPKSRPLEVGGRF